jgi:hypothetical protein
MNDDINKQLAKLKQQLADQKAEVEALKAKVDPPKSTFVPMSDAEWIDEMHQMRERRMSQATPPSVARYFADGVTDADCADIRRASHAPTGPSSQGVIPSSQPVSNVRTGGSATPGWVDPRPLSNPPGTNWVDAIAIADEVRQRKERERRGG